MWWIKATTLRLLTFLYIRGKETGENLNQLSWRIIQPKFCFIRQQIKCHDCKFNNKENPKSPCLSYICFSTLLKRPRFEIFPFFRVRWRIHSQKQLKKFRDIFNEISPTKSLKLNLWWNLRHNDTRERSSSRCVAIIRPWLVFIAFLVICLNLQKLVKNDKKDFNSSTSPKNCSPDDTLN